MLKYKMACLKEVYTLHRRIFRQDVYFSFYFKKILKINLIFQLNYARYKKLVGIQNCLLKEGLYILIYASLKKLYCISFVLIKKYYLKSKVRIYSLKSKQL